MGQNSRLLVTRRLFLELSALLLSPFTTLLGRSRPTTQTSVRGTEAPSQEQIHEKGYSPYANLDYPTRVWWGETHLHTSFSPDAGLVGDHLSPDEAFRFAGGEQIVSSTGKPVKLVKPYDWLVVTDHAECLGLAQDLASHNPILEMTEEGRKAARAYEEGGKAAYDMFANLTLNFASGKPPFPLHLVKFLARRAWAQSIQAAESNNKPGEFTTFIGFEWTSTPNGNNLHRNVVFRDGAERTKQVIPYMLFDSMDPVDLWRYCDDYEKKTGGRVLTIAHNPNLSCGHMFSDKTYSGQQITAEYAQLRARFDRLAEATQCKGDSETTPALSPEDQFADFERWNKCNIFGMVATTPEMLPYNYVRSAFKLGLQHQEQIGVDPFRYGLVGASDQHTSLCTTRAENYFGMAGQDEPSPHRWQNLFMASRISPKLNMYMWEALPGGMTGVWSRENTREAIWDALYRHEVYATTGTRPVIRIFGGWGFTAADLNGPDWVLARDGYAHGVPMGGELGEAPAGKAPAFLITAAADPDGAYLDRIQIIKGWLDGGGTTHEKVIDVAWSGDRKPDADGVVPLVGSTVDVKNATWTNTIGVPMLRGFWRDPDFDPALRAFYYVRVIEIPTPRWTAYDSKRFNVAMADYVPMTVTNRAYTSPIWYVPGKG
jgi:hypothetical protein